MSEAHGYRVPLLRQAHETPSESLRERRLKNDTILPLAKQCERGAFPEGKRLEKLFELYTKMTSK